MCVFNSRKNLTFSEKLLTEIVYGNRITDMHKADMKKVSIGYVEIVYDDEEVRVYNSYPIKDLLKALGFTFDSYSYSWNITASADIQRIEDLRYGIEKVKVLRNKGGKYWSYWDTAKSTSIRVNGQKVKAFETEGQFLEFLETLEEVLENLLRTSQGKLKKMVSEITVSREGEYSLKVDIGFKHQALEKALEKVGFVWRGDKVYTITIGHHREAERIARNLAELMERQDDEIVLGVLEKIREEVLSVGEEYRNSLKADIVIPAPEGKSYKEYQKEFVLLAKDRKKFILADEMGLGKTIQAIALINLLRPQHVLIVAPAFLRVNWRRELERWLTYDIDIYAIESRKDGMKVITEDRGIFIISYDLLDMLFDGINKRFELAVYDEAHYLKNSDAKRTVLGLSVKSDRYLFLTGTPFLNKAIELANIFYFIKKGIPEGVGQKDLKKHLKNFYWEFARKYFYLIEKEVRNNRKVYEVGDVKNPNRLSADLSPYILRRTKDEVLTELPDKIRKIIRFSADREVESLVEKEKILYMKLKEKKLTRAPRIDDEDISNGSKPDYRQASREQMMEYLQKRIEEMEGTLAELALVRHYLGLRKIDLAVEYIENILEETGDKRLVVMTWHKDVAYYIAKELESKYKVLLNTGDIKNGDDKVRQFQSDSEKTIIFISTIKAGGLGLTLTKASRMVFVELSYVPADIWQAEDRIHRIGQKNVAEIHFLIFDGSIDEHILSLVEKKKGEFTSILDISEAQEEQYRLFVEEMEE